MKSQCLRAFTLIEILIVISVIAILASMLMPVLQVVQRSARVTATRSIMHKTESALRLFRSEIGAYPYQSAYADTAAGEVPSNRLAYHLGTTIATGDLLAIQADAAAAAAAYAYDCTPPGGVGSAVEPGLAGMGAHAFRVADLRPATGTDSTGSTGWSYNGTSWVPHLGGASERLGTAVMLNRMGAERARRAVLAGHVQVTGTYLPACLSPTGAVYKSAVDRRSPLIPGIPASIDTAGWASDYLAGDLEARYRDDETILDAWRRPLIYVGQVVEGCVSTRALIFGTAILKVEARSYGLERQGRKILAPVDSRTGISLVADGAALPDPTRLFESDRRIYAAPGFEDGFELWSSGSDGRFDWMRSASGNGDNVGHEDYDRGLR